MEALTRNASAISRALCSVLQHTDKTQDIDPAHTVLYFKGRTEVMCVEEALASQAHSENLCVFSCVRFSFRSPFRAPLLLSRKDKSDKESTYLGMLLV